MTAVRRRHHQMSLDVTPAVYIVGFPTGPNFTASTIFFIFLKTALDFSFISFFPARASAGEAGLLLWWNEQRELAGLEMVAAEAARARRGGAG